MEQCLEGIYFCITKAPNDESRDFFRKALVDSFKSLNINMAGAVDNVFLFDPLGQNPDEGFNREQVCAAFLKYLYVCSVWSFYKVLCFFNHVEMFACCSGNTVINCGNTAINSNASSHFISI